MNLLNYLPLLIPAIFVVLLFVGFVKKNKRLWILSLIFLILSVVAIITLTTLVVGEVSVTKILTS